VLEAARAIEQNRICAVVVQKVCPADR
jgi:hypothetical protein